jgi:hypothetical protein
VSAGIPGAAVSDDGIAPAAGTNTISCAANRFLGDLAKGVTEQACFRALSVANFVGKDVHPCAFMVTSGRVPAANDFIAGGC